MSRTNCIQTNTGHGQATYFWFCENMGWGSGHISSLQMFLNTWPILDTMQKKKLSWLVDNPIDAKRLKDGNFYPSKIDLEHKKRRSTSHAPQHKKRFCQLEWKWHFQSFNHRYHGIPHRWINELHYPSMFAGSMLSYVVCLPYPV